MLGATFGTAPNSRDTRRSNMMHNLTVSCLVAAYLAANVYTIVKVQVSELARSRKHLILWAGLEYDPHVVRAFLALEGLPELRSFAHERRAEEKSAAAERTSIEESAEPAREEEVVEVVEQAVQNS